MSSLPIPEPTDPDGQRNERDTLTDFLDFYRQVLLRKGQGLTSKQLAVSIAPADLTIGGLIRHMTLVEDSWFSERLVGQPKLEPWASAPWEEDRDWEMTTATGMTFDELRIDFESACERSRAIMAGIRSLDTVGPIVDERPVRSARWILVHMIEEYARHCGHADFLAQSIDGRTRD
ncbi:MAG: hypothetical protein ACJAXA_003707 [Candidatus Aldehydirespiratoraceae bacterium]|jgi:hypothetical protein